MAADLKTLIETVAKALADHPPLQAIAERHNLALIEDAAQSQLATCDGRPIGTFGIAAASRTVEFREFLLQGGHVLGSRERGHAGGRGGFQALKEREDVAQLNAGLQKELIDKGMVINQPKAEAFRDKLRAAGFYAEWKGKYGDEAWAMLERYSGKLV